MAEGVGVVASTQDVPSLEWRQYRGELSKRSRVERLLAERRFASVEPTYVCTLYVQTWMGSSISGGYPMEACNAYDPLGIFKGESPIPNPADPCDPSYTAPERPQDCAD